MIRMIDEKQKDQLNNILDVVIAFSNKIEQWVVLRSEADDFFTTILNNIYKVFDYNSDEYRIFDRRKIETFWETIRKVGRWWRQYISWDGRLQKIIRRLSEFTGMTVNENEIHFKAWDTYKAKRYLSKLFRSAKNEILVVDNFIDWNIFDYIDEIDNKIEIKILTKDGGHKSFKNYYQIYDGWNVEARNIDGNHDRYIIIDKEKIFLIWTSLNWIWKKDFTVKELDSTDEINYLYWIREKSESIK